MPGETGDNGKHVLPPRKEQPIGQVISGLDFQEYATAGLVKPIADFFEGSSGSQYSLFLVVGFGLALGNVATKQVFMVGQKQLLALARENGIDTEPTIIVLPGGEVSRG